MTSTQTEQTTGPRPSARGALRLTRRLAVGAVVSVAIASGLTWWTHPDALGEYFGGFEAGPRDLADAALWIGLDLRHEEASGVVTVSDPDIVTKPDSARVGTRVWLCQVNPAAEAGIGAVGVEDSSWDEYCSATEPVDGPTRLRLDDRDYLVLEVTPLESGKWDLDHLTLSVRRDARHLFQRGTETVELELSGTVR